MSSPDGEMLTPKIVAPLSIRARRLVSRSKTYSARPWSAMVSCRDVGDQRTGLASRATSQRRPPALDRR
jgi:hypothetical protein